MKIIETFYSQTEAQKEKGNATYRITLEGEPSEKNLLEQYLAYAYSLGCIIFRNEQYFAIQYDGDYIIRIYNKTDGSFSIRYFPKDFRKNELMYEPKSKKSKITSKIEDKDSLTIVKQMLADKYK